MCAGAGRYGICTWPNGRSSISLQSSNRFDSQSEACRMWGRTKAAERDDEPRTAALCVAFGLV